ncbi:hypothetical protein HS088_TW20G00259 [Tripterygium wilfordii]|uniref:Uncharacterized protein n=1 Tax=Tripterygium wilfordii TaxID=458696 RepID=A0A7J7C6W7_TRIWF|nr:hypothetical protein HS088_TW20G00259 [Tripterygium wilfordii]
MATIATTSLCATKPRFAAPKTGIQNRKPANCCVRTLRDLKRVAGLLSSGLAVAFVGNASAVVLPSLDQLNEPANALSLPTWAIHVSSVVE